ncbi:hypothetical protein [Thiofilum flexile]|uniref:hypothetical protein n=1 Tax=Thiofilum flexile TaxID=125627 RepID=UPI00035DA79B|nr:hypothetical protein [Thiofilum flexile]
MLVLSEILLRSGDEILTFAVLKQTIQAMAIATGQLHFQIDIEPPAYHDRPEDWYEQLEQAFMEAGR